MDRKILLKYVGVAILARGVMEIVKEEKKGEHEDGHSDRG